MAAARTALAATAWNALIDHVADRNSGGDQTDQRMGVACHMPPGKPLRLAVAVGDSVIFGGFRLAAATGTFWEKHGRHPLKKARRFPSRGKPARQSVQSVL